MKVLFILMTSTLVSFATGSYSQSKSLTFRLENVNLIEIFEQIEKQSDLKVAYDVSKINMDNRINIMADDASIENVLTKALENTDLSYRVLNHYVIISSKDNELATNAQQQKSITGKVTDSTRSGLPGVSVVVKGTTTGVITDMDGKYTLTKIPENATLQFSFVGMKLQEIAVGNKSDINVVMIEEAIGLDEVVAVGYGKFNKRDLSTSIASMDTKNLSELSISNATQAMAGQLAGVSVQSVSGSPGNAPIIRIRGVGSLSAGNDPLVVVDGYPLSDIASFEQINPNDIEKIEVLKDAAAAAIYGSRGGNGVIMVTTKRGKLGQPRFNLTLSNGFDELSKKTQMLNAEQFVEYSKEAFSKNPTAISPAYYNDPSKWANTDWQDEIFRHAKTQNYQLSATGGTENLKYSISGGYLSQEGIVKGTDFERFNVRVNMDLQLNPKLKIGINLAPTYNFRNDRPTSSDQFGTNYYVGMPGSSLGLGIVYSALVQVPIMPVYLPNGDYDIPRNDPNLRGTSINQNFYNPLAFCNLMTDNTESTRLLGNSYLQYELAKGLSFKVNAGAESVNNRRNAFSPSTMAYGNNTNASFSSPNLKGITSAQATNNTYNWLCENTLTYEKSIGNHNLVLLAGYSAQKTTYQSSGVAGRAGSFNTDVIPYVSMSSDIFGAANKSLNSLISAFSRINYNFKQKYLFTASVRRDGSSRFGSAKQYATFPSFSGAWRVSDEPFLKNIFIISELKLRGSYGVTGNNNIGDFSSVAVIGGDHYTFGTGTGIAEYGYSPLGFSNKNLTWETNVQKDLGLELGLFKDKIHLSVDIYERLTKGLLSQTPISSLAGLSSSFLRNVGNIRNRGLEIDVVTHNLSRNLKWTTNFNFSTNKNLITDYYKEGPDYTAAVFGWNTVFQVQKGGSLGDIWGYVADGVFMNQAEVDKGPKWNGNASVAGDVRYKDLNGDGKITTDDRKVFANALPKFTYGLTNTFNYKSFDLNIMLQGSQGSHIIFGLGRNTDSGLNGSNNATSTILGRWKSEAEPGDGVTPRVLNSGNSGDFSSRFVYSGSFLRIRNVSFGYTLPSKITNKLKLGNAKIYLSGQNIFTFSNYIGYNPEVNSELGSSVRYGVDQGSYPLPRTYSLGINIGF